MILLVIINLDDHQSPYPSFWFAIGFSINLDHPELLYSHSPLKYDPQLVVIMIEDLSYRYRPILYSITFSITYLGNMYVQADIDLDLGHPQSPDPALTFTIRSSICTIVIRYLVLTQDEEHLIADGHGWYQLSSIRLMRIPFDTVSLVFICDYVNSGLYFNRGWEVCDSKWS